MFILLLLWGFYRLSNFFDTQKRKNNFKTFKSQADEFFEVKDVTENAQLEKALMSRDYQDAGLGNEDDNHILNN
ncbi:hypothetical protein [Candidatus Phytoplasma tritici]|uniref:hypothetical protein n=1 Tax=Candidatus Phytoplasma tritici TaxID=321961 RepID=UPI0004657973|nr:hypothetical protein [Candidatus Phytoplasma tritici]